MTKRDIEAELVDGIKATKAGSGKKFTVNVSLDIKSLRERLNLSQLAFAKQLGISVRTLQEWEQGRRYPHGPALSLLRIADSHPTIFKDQQH